MHSSYKDEYFTNTERNPKGNDLELTLASSSSDSDELESDSLSGFLSPNFCFTETNTSY